MKHRRFHPAASAPAPRARLAPRREALVYAILGLLWASGVGWLVFHYFLRQVGEFGELPHPAEAWWLRLHGAAAMAGLWLIGVLWVSHLLPGWKARRRPSGIVLGGALALLILSGYLLYYVGDEALRPWIGLAHWGIGLLLPLPLALHALRGRQPRRPPRDPHER